MSGDPSLPGLVDLIRLIESRATGDSTVDHPLDGFVPHGRTQVLVIFDGLGSSQLDHPSAGSLASARVADLSAPFTTTTTVSLSTVATAAQPSEHGVLSHLMWLPEHGRVVNTLKWVDLAGAHLHHDTSGFLPAPNLWERLRMAGIEPITVQPGEYASSPLTRMLYRGCRFEGVWNTSELIDATIALAATPGRLIMTYLPNIDVAAHVSGQSSHEYSTAMRMADTVWSSISNRIKPDVTLIGTADHGHIDYGPGDKIIVRDPVFDQLRCWGDTRTVLVSGDMNLIMQLQELTGAVIRLPDELRDLWGQTSTPHPDLDARMPDAALSATPGTVIVPKGFDKRLIGYHGGLLPEEVLIPLLVA